MRLQKYVFHVHFVYRKRVQFFGERAYLIYVGENYIAGGCEQRFVKAAEISDFFTYMKFIVRNFHRISVLHFFDIRSYNYNTI